MTESSAKVKKQWKVEIFDPKVPNAEQSITQIGDVYRQTQMTLPLPASKIAIQHMTDSVSGKIAFTVTAILLALATSRIVLGWIWQVTFKGWYDIVFLGVLVVVWDMIFRRCLEWFLLWYATRKYGELVTHVLSHDFSQQHFAERNSAADNNYCFVVRDETTGLVIASACLRAKEGEFNYEKTLSQKKGECMLSRVGTLPHYQRQGIQACILRECVRKARDLKCKRMWLQTTSAQVAAIHMYETLKFRLIQDTNLKFGVCLKTYELLL